MQAYILIGQAESIYFPLHLLLFIGILLQEKVKSNPEYAINLCKFALESYNER